MTAAPGALAEGASVRPEPEAEALMLELSHDLMSPYCPGRTIATCPSPQARKLEAQILEDARSGRSREEIESSLVGRFPDIRGYIGRPELVWGTVVMAVIALTMLLFVARRWVRKGGRGSVPAASPDAAGRVTRSGEGPGRGSAAGPQQREIDALDDALDRVDEF